MLTSSSALTAQKALSLLPPLSTTGIGSLPHSQQELGLQLAFQVDVPYLPQLPARSPGELMVPASLEGLPGLSFDDSGSCLVDEVEWRAGRARLAGAIEAALRAGRAAPFEPEVTTCGAWRPFLWEVETRKLAFAKVQLAGPLTVRWVAKLTDGRSLDAVPELEEQVLGLVLARGLALVAAVRRAGATPILFIDEPGLYALDVKNARHLVALQELKVLVWTLRQAGALVGLHCCSNTDWRSVLALELDFISLDVRLSLDALLEQGPAVSAFLARGGALSLGLIPTNVGASFDLRELVESVEASLRATLAADEPLGAVLRAILLTPACGLAMRSPVEAEHVFEQLREAQAMLRDRGRGE